MLLCRSNQRTARDRRVDASTEKGATIERIAFDPAGEFPDDDDEFVEDPEGSGTPGMEAAVVGAEDPSDDPPLLLAPEDSCANPTDIGLWRKTEYTFFKNVSPTTQLGAPVPASLPRERSNMAPTHIELPCSTWPRFMSSALIGHAWPPKDRVMLSDVVQGNWKNPSPPCPRIALAPGTAA